MTEEVLKEEQANPYNQKKAWHTGEDKPFESSEGLFFEKPSTEVDESDDIEMAKQEEVEEQKEVPYKKPDYKKRYDDLKNIMIVNLMSLSQGNRNYLKKLLKIELNIKLLRPKKNLNNLKHNILMFMKLLKQLLTCKVNLRQKF
jgi:hypothetical protein